MPCLITSPQCFFNLPLPLLKPPIASLSHLGHPCISFEHVQTISTSFSALVFYQGYSHLVLNIFILNLISPSMATYPPHILISTTFIFLTWGFLIVPYVTLYNIAGLTIIYRTCKFWWHLFIIQISDANFHFIHLALILCVT